MTRWDVRPVLPATAGRLWIGPTREGRPRMPVWASPGRGLQAAHPALCQSLKRQILAWKKSRRPRRTKTVVVVDVRRMPVVANRRATIDGVVVERPATQHAGPDDRSPVPGQGAGTSRGAMEWASEARTFQLSHDPQPPSPRWRFQSGISQCGTVEKIRRRLRRRGGQTRPPGTHVITGLCATTATTATFPFLHVGI